MSSEQKEGDIKENSSSFWNLLNRWSFLILIIWIIAYYMGSKAGENKFKNDILGI